MESGEYFSFKKMISSTLIKIIYVIGAVLITIFGIVAMFGVLPYSSGIVNVLWGLVILVLGNLIWRVTCEIWIVIFGIHDRLVSIESEIKKSGSSFNKSDIKAA